MALQMNIDFSYTKQGDKFYIFVKSDKYRTSSFHQICVVLNLQGRWRLMKEIATKQYGACVTSENRVNGSIGFSDKEKAQKYIDEFLVPNYLMLRLK